MSTRRRTTIWPSHRPGVTAHPNECTVTLHPWNPMTTSHIRAEVRCTASAPIDPTLTVNDVMACWPQTIQLLNVLGVDTCCGGNDSLREAARHAGIPLTVLLAAVEHGMSATGAK